MNKLRNVGLLFLVAIISINLCTHTLFATNNDYETKAVTDGTTIWEIESKTDKGIVYGSYINGPSARGPAKLAFKNGYKGTYSNTISGEYSNLTNIGLSFGVKFAQTYSRSVEFSIDVPEGKRYRLKYRPYYKKYKVVERAYDRLDGRSIKTNRTKVSYVKIYQDWDYDYEIVK